eukprot:6302346-Pyramimonas_sp.AAC.1
MPTVAATSEDERRGGAPRPDVGRTAELQIASQRRRALTTKEEKQQTKQNQKTKKRAVRPCAEQVTEIARHG